MSSASPVPVEHLGGDVWVTRERAPERQLVNGRMHFRFMDRLLIPALTSELCLDSIVAINRWRETLLAETDLPHRSYVRKLALAAGEAISCRAMLEIGSGKFPLAADFRVPAYMGLEIDAEARAHCRVRGFDMASSPEDGIEGGRFDSVFGLFSLQFPVSPAFGDLLLRMREDCVLIANLPTKDERLIESRLALLEGSGFALDRRFEFDAAHDRLLVASRGGGKARAARAVQTIQRKMAPDPPECNGE